MALSPYIDISVSRQLYTTYDASAASYQITWHVHNIVTPTVAHVTYRGITTATVAHVTYIGIIPRTATLVLGHDII